jgi:hypothetical protein
VNSLLLSGCPQWAESLSRLGRLSPSPSIMPLTGAVALGPVTKNSGEQIVLAQGSGAYIIKGTGNMVPNCPADTFSYSDGALVGQGGWYGSATSSQIATASSFCSGLGRRRIV